MIQEIGRHKVKLGNVMSGIDDLMDGEMADLIYSDPPWGEGNLKYWETMRVKMDKAPERSPDIKLDSFLETIFGIGQKYAKNVMLVEYGIKWENELKSMAQSFGFQCLCTLTTQYKSGSKLLPMHLHVFAKHPVPISKEWCDSVVDTYGYTTISSAVKGFVTPGGILLDPCCGMGYSAQAAVDTGMVFRGNEMNSTRLNKTIKRLK